MDAPKRAQNERKFGAWEELPDGGRRYSFEVQGRSGWKVRYVKEVDADEATIGFYQEVFDENGKLRARSIASIRSISVTSESRARNHDHARCPGVADSQLPAASDYARGAGRVGRARDDGRGVRRQSFRHPSRHHRET